LPLVLFVSTLAGIDESIAALPIGRYGFELFEPELESRVALSPRLDDEAQRPRGTGTSGSARCACSEVLLL